MLNKGSNEISIKGVTKTGASLILIKGEAPDHVKNETAVDFIKNSSSFFRWEILLTKGEDFSIQICGKLGEQYVPTAVIEDDFLYVKGLKMPVPLKKVEATIWRGSSEADFGHGAKVPFFAFVDLGKSIKMRFEASGDIACIVTRRLRNYGITLHTEVLERYLEVMEKKTKFYRNIVQIAK